MKTHILGAGQFIEFILTRDAEAMGSNSCHGYIWVFIAQLVEHCSANAEAMGSNPVEAQKKIFFGLKFAIA